MKKSEYERLKKLAISKLENKTSSVDHSEKYSLEELIEINEIYHAELEAQNEELQEQIANLEEAQRELQVLFNQAPIPYVILNEKMLIERSNEEALVLFGHNELRSKILPFYTRFDSVDIPRVLDWFKNIEDTELSSIELFLSTQIGRKRYKLHGRYWLIEKNKFYLISFEDVTEHRILQQHLKQKAKVFEHTAEGIVITDLEHNILSVNDAFTTITGYSKEEAIGNTPSMLRSDRHDNDFYDSLWADVLNKGIWKGEIWNKKKDGTIYPEWITISPIYDDNNKIIQYVGVFSDFSLIKEQQQLLKKMAHSDSLTSLPNRTAFYEQLEFSIKSHKRKKQSLAVMFVDLDHFKEVNDEYGHDSGDRVLIQVSNRLKNACRESDSVARLGGDEFIIALYDIKSNEDLEKLAANILDKLNDTIEVDGNKHHLGASIGISIYPQNAKTTQELIKTADIAMYKAKSNGKHCYKIFDESMI